MQQLQTILQEILASISDPFALWVAQAFLISLATGIASFLLKRIVARLGRSLSAAATLWDDDALKRSVNRPLGLLVWVIGLGFAARLVPGESVNHVGEIAQKVGVIFCVTWFFVRATRQIENSLIALRKRQDPNFELATAQALSILVRLTIVITGSLVMLQTLGISISGVLAFGGVGGIAVGFAARDLLANFFGGLMVYLDRPFAVGNWIRSPDREIEGTVEEIGWRLTRIRTFDSRPLYIPNAVFTNIVVENPSRMHNRRIHRVVGLRYNDIDKMSTIVDAVEVMLKAHEEIDTRQTMIINFDVFNESSIDFFIICFTKTTIGARYHQVKQDVLLQVADIIAAHGAEIAFPTRTVHYQGEPALGSPQAELPELQAN